jgi:hypothetical protein
VNVRCNYTIEVEEEEHGSAASSDGSHGSVHYASDTGSAYSSQLVRAHPHPQHTSSHRLHSSSPRARALASHVSVRRGGGRAWVVQTSEDGDAMSQLSYDNTVSSRGAEPHTPRGRTVSEYTQVWHSSPQQQPESGSSASAAATSCMASSSSSSRAHGPDHASLSMALVPYGAPSTPPPRRRRGRSFYRETYTEQDSWTFVMDSQVRPTNTHTPC